jgi:hypothetical protein
VVDGRGHLRLAHEPLPECLVVDEDRRQDLERDLARQAELLGTIDDPHPAAADDRLDPVGAEFGADAGVGCARHRPRPPARLVSCSARGRR